MKNFSAWPLRTLCAFVFGALVFSGMAQADTELKFEKAVFYGDKGDQIGSAAAFGAGRLYVAGSDMVSDSKGLVASFSTPPASAPLSDFRWPDNQPSALSVSTEFSDIAVASDGLYVAGSSLAQMTGKKKSTQLLGVLAKFPLDASKAKPVWNVRSNFFPELKEEVYRAVAVMTEFNSTVVYVTGHAVAGEDNLTAILAKYDANGNLAWSEALGSTASMKKSGGTSLAVSGDFIYVAGFTSVGETDKKFNSLPLEVMLWKYDSSGKPIWVKKHSAALYLYSKSNRDNLTHGVKVGLTVSDNYLYVTSGKKDNKASPGDVLLAKYDLDGRLIWENGWQAKLESGGTAKRAWSFDIAAGSDRLYVAGYLTLKGKEKNEDAFLIEVDKDYGSVLAVHTYGQANEFEHAQEIALAGTDVYVTGVSTKMEDMGKKKKPIETSDLILLRYSTLPIADTTVDIEPSHSGAVDIKEDQAVQEDVKRKKKQSKLKEKTIAVAILTTQDFKAPKQVRFNSLTFGRTGHEASWTSCSAKDVNGDSVNDLLCNFRVKWTPWKEPKFIFEEKDTEGLLKGMTISGQRLRGKDSVKIGGSSAPDPAPIPAPEPVPPLTSGPPAPTPTPEPEPIPEPPLTSSPTTPEPEPEQPSETAEQEEPVSESTPETNEPPPTVSEPETVPLPTLDPENITKTTDSTILLSGATTPQVVFIPPPSTNTTIKNTSPTLTSTAASSTSSTSSPLAGSEREALLRKLAEPKPIETLGGIFYSQESHSESDTLKSDREPLRSDGERPTYEAGLGKAYGDMGKRAFREGKLSEAASYYIEALKLDPKLPELHTGYGLVLMQQGNLGEAQTYFAKALELDPNDQTARENLNLILVKLGQPANTSTAKAVPITQL